MLLESLLKIAMLFKKEGISHYLLTGSTKKEDRIKLVDAFQEDVLFLFCGSKQDRFKALCWEGDGFVLMYKRIENGRLKWPRKREDACSITPEELHRLLDGLTILEEPSVRKAQCTEIS